MEHLLEIKNIETCFKTDGQMVKAVDGVSLYLDPGEIIGIVGESGSGKSVTMMRMLQLISSPGKITGGEVYIQGEEQNMLELGVDSEKMRHMRGGKVSMIFQEPMTSLNPVLTIGYQIQENIIEHLKMSKEDAKKRTIEMLKLVNIPDAEQRIDYYPQQFSGGMRQRIMIAMAMSSEPTVLVADEATTALDVTVQAQILGLIRRLQKETGTSVIFISHDMGVISQMADRVAVMYAGQLVEYADAEKIFSEPKHPYTQGLQAAIPRLDEQKDTLRSIPGNVPMLYELPKGCIFFPRCAFATERCHAERPGLVETEGHLVRCFQYEASESEKEQDVSEKEQAVQHDDRNAGSAAQGAEQKDEKGGAQV